MGFYIDDAGEGGLRQWLHFSKTAPFPCTPTHTLTPEKRGKGDHKTRNEQTVGLHFDFARRLPQSYILRLLDRRERLCARRGFLGSLVLVVVQQHWLNKGRKENRAKIAKNSQPQATFSNARAIPMPPLTQRVATPRLAFRFSISWIRVTVIRVPVHPMGCPKAIAPPLTFSLS
jgi:hypothetical protein